MGQALGRVRAATPVRWGWEMLNSNSIRKLATAVASIGLGLTACAPAGGSSGASQQGEVQSAPKIMTIGVARFVDVLQRAGGGMLRRGAGAAGIFWIAHEDLKAINGSAPVPQCWLQSCRAWPMVTGS